MKKRIVSFVISISMVLILTACDRSDPMGFRTFGFDQSNKQIIAVVPIWGIGTPGFSFSSADGGLTWIENKEYVPRDEIDRFFTADCTESCEFKDWTNERIRYRITPGKTLFRSLDGGDTWKEELRITDWDPIEKNYVNFKYSDIGRIKDIRGPFGAITDPTTGNFVVAMGFEGLLVRPQAGEWKWVAVKDYAQIHATRFDMLTLIRLEDWERGVFFCLFFLLHGLGRLGFKKYKAANIWRSLLTLWFILVPVNAHLFLIDAIRNIPDSRWSDNPVYDLIPALIIVVGIATMAYFDIKWAWQEQRIKIIRLIILSACIMVSYWLAFILWSQGIILTDYIQASVLGFILFIVSFVLVQVVIEKNEPKLASLS